MGMAYTFAWVLLTWCAVAWSVGVLLLVSQSSAEDSFKLFKATVLRHCNVDPFLTTKLHSTSSIPNMWGEENSTDAPLSSTSISTPTTTFLTRDDVQVITEHFLSTFYQHYKLFSFVFNNSQDILESEKRVTVQTCLPPTTPLSQAHTKQEWLLLQEQKRIAEAVSNIHSWCTPPHHFNLLVVSFTILRLGPLIQQTLQNSMD